MRENIEALEYHSSQPAGKIEIRATKPFVTQRDLSLAYTPGVAEPCREIHKNPEALADNFVAFSAFDVGDEAYTAIVMLMGRVIEPSALIAIKTVHNLGIRQFVPFNPIEVAAVA